MAVQSSEFDKDVPKVASEATPPNPDLTKDSAKMENSESEEISREESPEVKSASEKIVSNAVSIDVLPEAREKSAACTNGTWKKSASTGDNGKKSNKENALARYWAKKTEGLTNSQVAILCIFPFVEFFAATVISIQGPFYPQVAREKGATPWEYGLVFGSFEIVVFIMAPIYGAKMGNLNPHRLFNYGIFTTSVTCFLFGFVHHIDDRVGFILMSLFIRVIEAIGDAAFVTASFSIIAIEFPDTVATTFAMMETFYGLGMIAGPTVGGALFGAGGFTFPFAIMGGLLFISAIATYTFITRVSTADVNKIVSSSSFDMFKMLKIPAIALTAYGTFAAATGIGFLSNNLEHHLSQFHLTEFQVGCIFMLNGGVYALSAPFWGRLCDKTSQLKVYSVVGSVLTIFGFVLIGPLPFIPNWLPSIPVICLGLVIFGLGLGSTLVSAFIQFLHDALANGRPEDVTTHGLVSGLWTSMTALGFFVGPTCGGYLDHAVGFRWGTLFILVEQFLLVGLLIYFFVKLPQPAASAKKDSPIDNLDDIVITYALKMNTPNPKARRRSSSVHPIDAKIATDGSDEVTKNAAESVEAIKSKAGTDDADVTPDEVPEDLHLDEKNADATKPAPTTAHKSVADSTAVTPSNAKAALCEDDTTMPSGTSGKGLDNPNFVSDQ